MKFPAHHEDYPAAKACAEACESFTPDDEDEWTADDLRSCFNCLKRRWTPASMICMKESMK